LVRDEVKAASTRNLNSLLQGKLLEAVVTIHDVKMKNSHTATLTVGGFDTPKLAQEKNISFSILSGPISIDLPMTLETARNIKPGQRLLLRGAATYEPGNMIAIIMPWRSAFMRLNFHGPSQQGAIIALAPTEFRFVETSNDVSRPPPISPTNAPKPKVIAPVAKRADSYSELHSSFANKFRYHHEGARLCQTPQPVAMRSENGFLINMMARRKPVF